MSLLPTDRKGRAFPSHIVSTYSKHRNSDASFVAAYIMNPIYGRLLVLRLKHSRCFEIAKLTTDLFLKSDETQRKNQKPLVFIISCPIIYDDKERRMSKHADATWSSLEKTTIVSASESGKLFSELLKDIRGAAILFIIDDAIRFTTEFRDEVSILAKLCDQGSRIRVLAFGKSPIVPLINDTNHKIKRNTSERDVKARESSVTRSSEFSKSTLEPLKMLLLT